MCDTVIATGSVTADGVTLFGKNSDREPNEAHHLLAVPAANHPKGSTVTCTYIPIPQAPHTFATLLAKPFWIWGAEMGVNEHQVAIGNEAVFTKVPYRKKGGLIGMDLLRLGLERGATARQALDVMTTLLAQFGQGGNCGLAHKSYYHNSFLIADPDEAWVLETADSHWAAKRVNGIYTISNGLTIGKNFDLASPNLMRHAIDQGWCQNSEDFDFARCYSDTLYTHFSDCHHRCQRTTALLEQKRGAITPNTLLATLRDHQRQGQEKPSFAQGMRGLSVCMHAGFGPIRGSQTTGSMVSHLHSRFPTHFFTATAAPCTSTFKPVWLDADMPIKELIPTEKSDPATLFWRHEKLHRATLQDYQRRIALYQAERNQLEHAFVSGALECARETAENRYAFSQHCFAEADEAEARWLKRIQETAVQQRPNWHYRLAWHQINRLAGF